MSEYVHCGALFCQRMLAFLSQYCHSWYCKSKQ